MSISFLFTCLYHFFYKVIRRDCSSRRNYYAFNCISFRLFFHIEHFPRIEDQIWIKSLFDGFHEGQGRRVLVFGKEGLALLADAVFAGNLAAQGIDGGAGRIFKGVYFRRFFVGCKAAAKHIEVQVAVASMADAAELDALRLPARRNLPWLRQDIRLPTLP